MFRKKDSDFEEFKRYMEAKRGEIETIPGTLDQGEEREKENIIRKYQKKGQLNDIIKIGAVVSVIGIIGVSYYLTEGLLLVMMLLGSTMFLPVGFITGWFLLDPFNRARFYRFVLKKNYGIIYLKGKGKNLIAKIKNFDDSLLWVENNVFHFSGNQVRQLGKDDNIHLDSSDFNYLNGVPALFFDIDNMKALHLEGEENMLVGPGELGSALKGWNYNQIAKILFFKRNFQILILICILASAFAGAMAYFNYMTLNQDLLPMVKAIKTASVIVPGNATIG